MNINKTEKTNKEERGSLKNPKLAVAVKPGKSSVVSEPGCSSGSQQRAGPSNKEKTEDSTLKAKSQKVLPQSKKLYRERRSAYRLKDKILGIPEEERTEKQKAQLAWSIDIIAKKPEAPKVVPLSKRQRSSDGDLSGAKRIRAQETMQRSFRDVVKDGIVVAVIDRNDDEGRISRDNWKSVECTMATTYMQLLTENPGPVPKFRDAGWFKGVKLTSCSDQRAVDLYKKGIKMVGEVWPGAKLEVVGKDEIPSRPRARAWIPVTPSDSETILGMIKASNPEYPTQNWKIVKLEEPKGKSRLMTLIINKESLGTLAKNGGVISYGFMDITLKTYNTSSNSDKSKAETQTEVADDLSKGEDMELDTNDTKENVVTTASESEMDLMDSDVVDNLESFHSENSLEDYILSEDESNITVVEVKKDH